MCGTRKERNFEDKKQNKKIYSQVFFYGKLTAVETLLGTGKRNLKFVLSS
jgi:hypothetical protein